MTSDDAPRIENTLSFPEDTRRWVLMPGNSRLRNRALIAEQELLKEDSERSPFNRYTDGPDKSLGIIVSGIASNYLNEVFPDGCPFPTVKVSQYPLPCKMIGRLADETEAILVIEEGQPVI